MQAYAYLENDVLSMEPLDLTRLLYAKAIERLNQARHHLESGKIRERSEAIAHAQEIVMELQASLNGDAGEIAESLAALYGYIQLRLADANARQSRVPLDEAAALLETLYEGWKECRPEPAGGQTATDLLLDSVPSEMAGQAWTL
jgi:flagellar protein FliS